MQLFMTSPASPKTTTGQSRPMSRPLGSPREIRMGDSLGGKGATGSKGASHGNTHSPSSYLQKARQALSKDTKPKNTDSTQKTHPAVPALKTEAQKETSHLTSRSEGTHTATRTDTATRPDYLSRLQSRVQSRAQINTPHPSLHPNRHISHDALFAEVTHSLQLSIQAIQNLYRVGCGWTSRGISRLADLLTPNNLIYNMSNHVWGAVRNTLTQFGTVLSALARSVVLGLHAGGKFILRGAILFQKRVGELLQLLGKTQGLRKEVRNEIRFEPTFTPEPVQTPAVERTDAEHTSQQSSPIRSVKRRPLQKGKSAYQVGEIVQGVVIGAIRDSLSYGLYVRLNDGEVGVLPRHKMPGKALRIHIGVGARLQLLVCQVPPKGLTLAYHSHLRD